jgi:diguanylate cyclase (GGDEF)-like protein/PAS domain S-box-containing protein
MDGLDIAIYQHAFEASTDAIICSDETDVITFWNPAAERMFGYSKKAILGRPISQLMPEEFRSAHKAGMSNFIRTGKSVICGSIIEVRGLRMNNTTFPIELSISSSKINGWIFIAIIRDITSRKKIEDALHKANSKLKRLSLIDGLTGISNRRMFDLTLAREWASAKRHQSSIALIMIDIDFFKLYNDNYGHLQGDDCLKEVAKALLAMCHRDTDIVARFGGEEFVILLPDTDIQQAITVAEKCRKAVIKRNILHEHTAVIELSVVSVSLGVTSVIPNVKADALSLINTADQLLYKAKGSGRNRVEY